MKYETRLSNQIHISRQQFTDFDEYAEHTRQGTMELSQLDSGLFMGKLTHLISEKVIIASHKSNRTILQEGVGMEGYTVFLIPGNLDQVFNWRKTRLSGNSVGFLKGGGMEHEALVLPGFFGLPVSIKNEYLFSLLSLSGYPDLYKQISSSEYIDILKQKKIDTVSK